MHPAAENRNKGMLLRWLIFNGAGLLGVGIQLLVLTALTRLLDVHYLLATALAVEAALLHNFLWHERVTWRERTKAVRCGWRWRLLRYNLANGLVSILGNLLLMRWFVGTGVPLVVANLVAIATCSCFNFAVSELFVFRRRPAEYREDREHLFI